MRKNWKRILAATLAACMIFCDSSLVYAAESQPIVEASETEVETTEIGDEMTLPEATEEDVVTEESTEEVEDVEPVEETEQEEILPEEEPTEEEKEIVEIMPVNEVSSVVGMNEAVDGTQLDLDVFQDTIKIPAGETVTVTYNGKHLGDYFISPVDGVEFNSVSVGPGLEGGLEYEYFNNPVVGYGLKDEYDPETTDTATFTFKLTNNTESDKDISIFNSLSNSLGTYTEGAELKLGDYENVADSEEIENVGYYRFTPTTTTLYYHNDLEWIIREGAEKNVRADKHKAANGAVILNAGETYILKFSSEEYYSEGFEGYEYGEKDNEKISYTTAKPLKVLAL